MRATAALLLAAGLLAAAGCSDDDEGGSTTVVTDPPSTTGTTSVATTSAPATTATPPTTDPPTTSTPLTTTTPPTTTAAPVDEEALKAQIAKDYERAFYRSYQMVGDPRLRNLEERAARVLVRNSPAFDSFVARIEELVALGDAVVPNDPDLLAVTVENVELVGEPPYRRAIVTACEVDNRKQVTLPENSPTGESIPVAGAGVLQVIRFEEPVRRTNNGWLPYRSEREGIGFEQGETTCPPP